MDKNAIKKFAVWARTELIARVSLKGVEYGITEDNIEAANADSVGGKVLTADEKKQRQALIAEINDKGRESLPASEYFSILLRRQSTGQSVSESADNRLLPTHP